MPLEADSLVVVVDDESFVRTGLSRALRGAGYAVEAYGSGEESIARVQDVRVPCCIVADARMPRMDGLEMLQRLASIRSPVALIVISKHATVSLALRAMKAGAVDVLEKPISTSVLVTAVAAALDRARASAERMNRMSELRARFATLTRRERHVFALVTGGLSNKEVGFELGTSEKTVEVQRGRVTEKMRPHSLAELVRMADALGVHSLADVVAVGADDAGGCGGPRLTYRPLHRLPGGDEPPRTRDA